MTEQKYTPFNLEEALSGKPVILRDGNKAYVIGKYPEEWLNKSDFPLKGCRLNMDANLLDEEWQMNGRWSSHDGENLLDIIGMFPQKKTMWLVVGHNQFTSNLYSSEEALMEVLGEEIKAGHMKAYTLDIEE